MSDDTIDYRRAKTPALQALARAGDRAALAELQRRGVAATSAIDVTRLDDAALRALVAAWNDGPMPADRERNRELAEAAYAERLARFWTDMAMFRRGKGDEPAPPAVPPWAKPRARRLQDWQRPTSSKCYRDTRPDAFNAMAANIYRQRSTTAAGVPQKG